MQKALFSDGELDSWLSEMAGSALSQVQSTSPELLRADPEGVFDNVISNCTVRPLEIGWTQIWREDPREVPAVRKEFDELIHYTAYGIAVHVPFAGSSSLLERRPSTRWLSSMPAASVAPGEFVMDIQMLAVTSEDFERLFAREREGITVHVNAANAQVIKWMNQLELSIREAIAKRKDSLDSAAAVAATLSIPARPAPGATQVIIPAERTSVRIVDRRTEPIKSSSQPHPEYSLDRAIYEDIVRTLRSVGNSMERLPDTARKFDEEELRDLLLFILNSNYEGSAGGELFNGAGKTDILVRHEDRNAFIGECKIWGGPAAFKDAIDQLLGYTVWRDTKAALIVFIKNKNATAAIESADQTIRDHMSFIRAVDPAEPHLRRDYVLHAKDDPTRLIRTALLPIVIREA